MLNHEGPQDPRMLSFLVSDGDCPSKANCPLIPIRSAQMENPREHSRKCLHESSPLITTQVLIM